MISNIRVCRVCSLNTVTWQRSPQWEGLEFVTAVTSDWLDLASIAERWW